MLKILFFCAKNPLLVGSMRTTNQSPAGLGPLAAKSDTATGHQPQIAVRNIPELRHIHQHVPLMLWRVSHTGWPVSQWNEQTIISCQRQWVGSSSWCPPDYFYCTLLSGKANHQDTSEAASQNDRISWNDGLFQRMTLLPSSGRIRETI